MPTRKFLLLCCLAWSGAAVAAAQTFGLDGTPVAHAQAEWVAQARMLERRADWAGLLGWGRAWAAAAPHDALARFVQGRALEALQRPDEAAEAYRQALLLDPDDVHARNNLGNLHRSRGRYRDALLAYREAVTRQPDYLQGWRNLGLTFYLLNGPAGVGRALDALRRSDPRLADAWQALATDDAAASDPDAAQQRALRILQGLTPAQRERLFDLLLAGV